MTRQEFYRAVEAGELPNTREGYERFSDPLYRPPCTRCHERPVYLAGLCGKCYAHQGQLHRAGDHSECFSASCDLAKGD